MKETGTFVVLAYLILATFAEVYLSGTMTVGASYYAAIGTIAISEALVMGAYFMRLKDEPISVRSIALIGAIFIAVLIISMVLDYM